MSETLPVRTRDYSLVGIDGARALESGLASAQWYSCLVPRKQMKALMQRRDGPAIRDTALWFACLALSGSLGVYFWGPVAGSGCVPLLRRLVRIGIR